MQVEARSVSWHPHPAARKVWGKMRARLEAIEADGADERLVIGTDNIPRKKKKEKGKSGRTEYYC